MGGGACYYLSAPCGAGMKLPNPDHAIVDLQTLREYCLNPFHQRGRHKSGVFLSALGVTAQDAQFLRNQLLKAAKTHDCRYRGSTEFGDRYEIWFELIVNDRRAMVCSAWFVRRHENFARLASCYVVP